MSAHAFQDLVGGITRRNEVFGIKYTWVWLKHGNRSNNRYQPIMTCDKQTF